jgi:Flp pilus assembly protein TadG
MMHRLLSRFCRQSGQPAIAAFPLRVRTKPGARKRGATGQVLVLVAIGIIVVMGFAALAVDVGQFWSVRRDMQTAADAGAVAGAIALRLSQDPTAAANSATAMNGFTNGTNSVTVKVNNPPASGIYAGNTSYVEVIVTQPQPTYFMRVLGYNRVTVGARSVASSVNSPACFYALDPSSSGAATVSGSSAVTLDCGAMINSSNSSALVGNGGATLTAANIGVAGGYSGGGFTPIPITGIAPAPDPLAYLQPPTVGACNFTNVHVGNGGAADNLQPGVYCGGIQVSGNNPVTFASGVYILEGGLKVTAKNATISGTDVMFYNTQSAGYSYGEIALSGSTTVHLSAPTTGQYPGILFFQDRSIPTGAKGSTITGSSGSTFDGAIYFPTTAVSYSGSSSSDGYTIIVGYDVWVGGNSVLGDNYSSLPDGSPIRSTALYE